MLTLGPVTAISAHQPYLQYIYKRARSYAGVVFMRFGGVFLRFCHVLKEFPRLRSRF